jgi:ribosomal protein S18 acetylase RimI-like enzyme
MIRFGLRTRGRAPRRTRLATKPLTPARWRDFESVFDARGCSQARNCGCMFYRRTGASKIPSGDTAARFNRRAMRALVESRAFVGLVGYAGAVPVGWVSFGPREDFHRLARSPVMKPIDDERVWSIVCFVVPPGYRGRGVAHALLDGAIRYARRRRVRLLEAYPVDATARGRDDAMWFGARRMYDRAGFVEVARRKPGRPVMRLALDRRPDAERAEKATYRHEEDGRMAKTRVGAPATPFPKGVAQPAVRALASVGVKRLEDATRFTEAELAALHGMGPKALGIIKDALRAQGKSLRTR